MSYKYGIAALNLEMTDLVPRTEYSVIDHYDLVKKITGFDRTKPGSVSSAIIEMMKAWDFSINWNVLISKSIFGNWQTSMGHAEYAYGGSDRNDNIYCPFKDEEDAFSFDLYEKIGEINISDYTKAFNEHYINQQNFYSDIVNMTGIYTTCMSGLIDIFGWDLLLSCAGADPKRFGELTNRYCDWISQFFYALAKSNSPVVMIHDDIVWTEGAFIHPDWYRKYVFPNYKKLFKPLIENGKKILYTSDGNFTEFIDDIADCGVNCFVLEPLTDMQYIADKYGKTHSFIGNADTRVLLSGTKEDIYAEVKRCMDIGKKHPGFIMAVGNHIPANTPVDNCLYYNDFYMQMRKR